MIQAVQSYTSTLQGVCVWCSKGRFLLEYSFNTIFFAACSVTTRAELHMLITLMWLKICLAACDEDLLGPAVGVCARCQRCVRRKILKSVFAKSCGERMCVCQVFEVCVSSESWWIPGRLSELTRRRAAGNDHMLIISSGRRGNRAGQIRTALDKLGVWVCVGLCAWKRKLAWIKSAYIVH